MNSSKPFSSNDPWATTQPVSPQSPRPAAPPPTRPVAAPPPQPAPVKPKHKKAVARQRSRGCGCGCTPFLGGVLLGITFLLAIYLLVPARTNTLLLGIDFTPPENAVGRSDTMILSTVNPLKPYVAALSIPRDLWVNIPGVGENRINTAHFFAEANQAGAGPLAAIETVRQNFGVDIDYYLRVRFDGFRDVINAMGGVDLVLPEPMAGYPAGPLHLNGNKALAFARSRAGSDDFFRMQHAQLVMKAALQGMLNPLKWGRIPLVLVAASRSIDTNIPAWLWPRLGLALLRAGPNGIDSRIIDREMVIPTITQDGANILIPDWSKINPVLIEMFGQ
jgi:polyisoprenyl-teichoic acid--peptidoglycan teichoic acid transferase